MGLFDWLRNLFRNVFGESRDVDVAAEAVFSDLRVTPLEKRRVLNGDPAGVQELMFDAGGGMNDGEADVFRITEDADELHVELNGDRLASIDPSLAAQIQIVGSSDDDTLELNVSNEFLRSASLSFVGAAGQNLMRLTGDVSLDRVDYRVDDVAGFIRLEGSGQSASIEASDTLVVEDHLKVAERTFQLHGDSDHIDLNDGEHRLDGRSQIAIRGDMAIQFANPTETLTLDVVDLSSDRDAIVVSGLDESFAADLSIVGGEDDSVQFAGRTYLRGGDIDIRAGDILVDGEIETDHADVDLQASRDFSLSHDGRITNANGTTSVFAEQVTQQGDIAVTGGRVVITAADRLELSGQIDVSDDVSGRSGGVVELTADRVMLVDDAVVNASGTDGGGAVFVGASPSNDAAPSATYTMLGADAKITADAYGFGNGGEIVIWSDNQSVLPGTSNLSARGGALGGDGGWIETSGKHLSQMRGAVDVSAPLGAAGTWLIDPIDVVIRTGGATSVLPGGGLTDSATDIDAASIVTALAAGSTVTIRTDGADDGSQGDINIQSGLDAMAFAGLTGTLELVADNDIIVEAGSNGIVATSGSVNLDFTAGGSVMIDSSLNTGAGMIAATADGGDVTMADGTTATAGTTLDYTATGSVNLAAVDVAGGTVTILADSDADGTGAITDGSVAETANIRAASVTLDAAEGIGGAADADIDTDVDSLQAANRFVNGITLQETDGIDVTGVTTLVGGGNISVIVDSGDAQFTGFVIANGAGNVSLTATSGTLTLGTAVSSTSGNLGLAGSAVAQNADLMTTGAIAVTATNGAITMADGTTTTSGATIDYFATDDVAISALVAAAGNVNVAADTDADNVGAITDNTAAEVALITAQAAVLLAAQGIGGTGASDIDLNVISLTATNSTSNDIVAQQASDLIVVNAATSGGDGNIAVTVDAGNLTVNGAVSADGAGDVIATAAAGTLTINGAVSSTSGAISLLAEVVDQNADISTDGTVDVTASAGSITMADGTTTAGGGQVDYNATADIRLSAISSANSQILVTADTDASTDGAIFDNTALESSNLSAAGGAVLSAATGVGGAAAANLDTQLGALSVSNTNSGDVRIDNAGIDQLALNVISNAGGDIEIDHAGGLTVATSVTASGNVQLTAVDDAADATAPEEDNLTISGGASVQSATGDVSLRGGDDVTVEAGATITAFDELMIRGDFSNADVGSGATVEVRGTLTSGMQPTIEGDSDADTFTVTPSATNVIQILGRNPVVAPGDTLNAVTPAGQSVQLNQTSTSAGTVAFSGGFQDLDYVEIEHIAISGIVTLNGTGNDDTLTIDASAHDAATTQLTTNGAPAAGVNPVVGLFELVSLEFNALGGDDQLILNHPSNDVFAPTGGITYHGGASANDAAFNPPGDRLTITGPTDNAVINRLRLQHRFDPASVVADGDDGQVRWIRFQDAAQTIVIRDSSLDYTGLDSPAPDPTILDLMNVADREFLLTNVAETVRLSDDGGAAGSSRLEATLSPTVQFRNPTNSTSIDTTVGSGSDTLNIEGLDPAYDASLSVLGDGDDDVNFQTNPTDIGPTSNELRVTGRTVNIAQAVTASGLVDIQADDDVRLTVVTTTGDVQIASTNGAIIDISLAETENILSPTGVATLSASTGIGGVGVADIDTQVGTLTATNALANDIFVQEVNGLIVAGAATNNGNGSINIDVDSGNASVTAPVAAHGAGTIMLNVDAGTLTLNSPVSSGSGAIALNATSIQQNSNVTTTGAVTATAVNGSIVMADGSTTSAGGQLVYTATEDLGISTLATTGAVMLLTADSDANNTGAISDVTAAETVNLMAAVASVTLTAATGIGGAAAADLETQIQTVTVINSTNGDIGIQEADGLEIITAVTQAGDGDIAIDVDAGNVLVVGPVTANGGGDVTLNADAGSMTLDSAVSSTSGNIRVTADSVQQNANITTTGAVLVTADVASVVMDAAVSTSAGGSLDYSAAQDVQLSVIVATAGAATVTADNDANGNGAIVDITVAETINITATSAALVAATGIGDVGAADIDTDVDTLSAANSTSGNVVIQELNGLTLNGAETGGGNGSVRVDVDNGDAVVSGPVSANGSGDIVLDVNLGSLTLNANTSSGSGDITLLATEMLQNANVTTGGAITATVAAGSITMVDGTTSSAGGSLEYTATLDVAISSLISTAGDVTVVADSENGGTGAILDATAGEATNVSAAGMANFAAANGIGGVGDADIETQVATLQAVDSTSNDIVIHEIDGLNIAGAVTVAGNGNIDIDVDGGAVNVNGSVIANGAGTVTLNADAGVMTLGALVSSTSGAISISADAVQQNANVATAGTVSVTADNGSIVMADATSTTSGDQLDYVASDSVALSMIATTGAMVTVTADSDADGDGAISDVALDESPNISAAVATVTLAAADGIGGIDDADLDTLVATISASNSSSNDIVIQEANGLTIDGATTLGGNGSISFDVDSGNVIVSGSVTTHGTGAITLNADAGSLEIGNGNVDDIDVRTNQGVVTIAATQLQLADSTPIQTNGGTIDLTNAARVRLDVDVNLDTRIDAGDAGDVLFSTAGSIDSLVAGASSLSVDTTSPAGTDGNVDLTDVGSLQRLESLTIDAGVGTIRLQDSSDVNSVAQIQTEGLVSLAGLVRLAASTSIDTNSFIGLNAGNVDLGNAPLESELSGADLTIDTSVADASAAGEVRLNTVGDLDGAFVRQLRIVATSAANNQVGTVLLNGDSILLDGDGAVSSLFEIVGRSPVILESDVLIDTEQGDTDATNVGDVRLGNTTIMGDTASDHQLRIDTSTMGVGSIGGTVVLGTFGAADPDDNVSLLLIDAWSTSSDGGNIRLMGDVLLGDEITNGRIRATTSGSGVISFDPGDLVVRTIWDGRQGDISGDIFLDLANDNDFIGEGIVQTLRNTADDAGDFVRDQGLIVAARRPSDEALPESAFDPDGNASIVVHVVDDFAGENLEITVDWFGGVPEEFQPDLGEDPKLPTIVSYPREALGEDPLNANETRRIDANYQDFFTTESGDFDGEQYAEFTEYAREQELVPITVTATFDPRQDMVVVENGIVFTFLDSTVAESQNQVLTVDVELSTFGLLPSNVAVPTPAALPISVQDVETLNVNFEFSQSEPNFAQSQVAGVTTGAASERPARFYELRIVTYDNSGDVTELALSRTVTELLGARDSGTDEVREFDPSQLPELFRRLPDDRYRLYLVEEGAERMILDFVIRQGQPAESQDVSSDEAAPGRELEDIDSQQDDQSPDVTLSPDPEVDGRIGLTQSTDLGGRVAEVAGRVSLATQGPLVLHSKVPQQINDSDWATSIQHAMEQLGRASEASETEHHFQDHRIDP